ncbi:hypothetical protein [Streptomyces sp. NPDC005953]|uniref:hypothetical protein n=1 Tax=unclassified Streptomyces TaxID=2593676 RepID=UPI00340034FB
MLAEALTALAGAGGTALVGAMATDVWSGARAGVVQLFGRDDPDRPAAIETQLDNDADTVTALAEQGRADRVREELALLWTLRLTRLLEQQPEAEGPLRELVDRLRDERPSTSTTWQQTNTARDGSTQFAVQGGNVVYHQSPRLPSTDGGATHR